MEHAEEDSIQIRVRGPYERVTIDTGSLAHELSTPQDFTRIISDFDEGNTPLRDVGKMITAQRTAILEAYQTGTINNISMNYPEVLSIPVSNLHERVVSGVRDQPIGHNFFVNATGFLSVGISWAVQFNNLIKRRTGASLYDIAQSDDMQGKDRLLATITENPDSELMGVLAVYLAGRSRAGEQFLERQYGNVLEQAKNQAFATIQNISEATELRGDMVERASQQLQRVAFGSFDHLDGLITSRNSGAKGDYHIGTLRVEVHSEGDVQSGQLRNGIDVSGIITHEVHHAISAQSRGRCGLHVNGQGLEVNEGMTEYLSQLSTGSPGIEDGNGFVSVREWVPYRVPLLVMIALHKQFEIGQNNYFPVLFNTYQGDVRDKQEVEQALNAFYRHEDKILNRLQN